MIGCGPIGCLHAQAIAGSGHAGLVAVCDPDASRREAIGGELSVPDVRRRRSTARRACARRRDDRHARPLARAAGAGRHRGWLPRVLREALGRRTDRRRADRAGRGRSAGAAGRRLQPPLRLRLPHGPQIARRGSHRTINAGRNRRQRRHAAVRRCPASPRHLHHAADASLRPAALVRRRSQPTAGNRRPNSDATLVRDVTVECTLAGGIPGTLDGARTSTPSHARASG